MGSGQAEQGADDDDYGFDEEAWLRSPENRNHLSISSALHPAARHLTAPDFRPRIPSRDMPATAPPKSEFFDESATFSGAINPKNPGSWLEGWTAFPES